MVPVLFYTFCIRCTLFLVLCFLSLSALGRLLSAAFFRSFLFLSSSYLFSSLCFSALPFSLPTPIISLLDFVSIFSSHRCLVFLLRSKPLVLDCYFLTVCIVQFVVVRRCETNSLYSFLVSLFLHFFFGILYLIYAIGSSIS